MVLGLREAFLGRLILLSVTGIAVGGLGYTAQEDRPLETAQGEAQPVVANAADEGIPQAIDAGRMALSGLESVVRLTYPDIDHVEPPAVAVSQIVLADVREADEYIVSRIPGAVRIDPESSIDAVLQAVGDVSGKQVVFYCSVGLRSSTLARRVRARLRQAGAVKVANLSGGLFRWHNEDRALVNGLGETDLVHKFSDYWGQLIRRQSKAVLPPTGSASAQGPQSTQPSP